MIRLIFLILASSCFGGIALRGQLVPDFHDEIFLNGFDFPTGVTFDDNGRAYVWEKPGRVIMVNENRQRYPQPLLDITEEVSNWKDHGLMGFCLDNDFLENGYIYLLYALDLHYYENFGTEKYYPDSSVIHQPTIGRVTRYTANPATNFTTIIPGSRKVLLGETLENGIPLLYDYHGLGSLIMGEDRSLLISSGDATSNISADIGGDSLQTPVSPAIAAGILTPDQDVGSYRSQYLGNYNGKILRIDPDTGDGLPSNPFYDPAAPRAPRSRIWTYGLRNPYRIAVRPETGSHYLADGNPGVLYIGDVGNGGWEEINVASRGGQNFGWPITEGLAYNRAFFVTSVPMNRMAPNKYYRDGACGAPYFNFRETFRRPALYEDPTVANPCNPLEPLSADLPVAVERLPAIVWNNSRWNANEKAAVPGFDEAGQVKSIPLDDPACPVKSELFSGFSSLAGIFYPEDGTYPEEYQGKYFGVDYSSWIKVFDFSDDQELTAVSHFHTRADDIIHLAYNPADGFLYYIDVYGALNQISYGGNPAPVARITADRYYGSGPLTVQFDGTASSDDSGPIAAYRWDFGDGTTSHESAPVHTFTAAGSGPESFTVRLQVTDDLGLSRETSVIVSLNNTPPEANISSIREGDQYPTTATTVLRLAAAVKDAEHSQEELSYEWRVFFHHNDHFHPEPVDFKPESFLVVNPLGCEGEIYYYRIELKVTDAAGLSTSDQRIIYPYCEAPFVGNPVLAADLIASAVALEWTTDFESEITEMIIQRSHDYFHFENIGMVDPLGNSDAPVNYHFLDPAPARGNNIYRIKIRQQDTYTYTNLETVTFPRPADVRISPNPARGYFKVEVREAYSERLQFELYAVNGARLMRTSWNAALNRPFVYQLLTTDFPAGIYFYRLVNGGEEAGGKLIIR